MTRRILLVVAAAAALASCKRAPGGPTLGAVSLPNADGSKTVSLGACPTERCLTIYVAPWCGYCRAATPMLRDMRVYLRAKGMESWVVVGMDRENALRDYARDFGSDSLLDANRSVEVGGGVPHFFVLDKTGQILRHIAGLPPNPADLVAWILKP